MAETRERCDIDSLQACVDRDPGAPEFPALAEALRRAGRATEARRVSEIGLEHAPGRMAGRVSLGLALLELGEAEEAKRALAAILDSLVDPHALVSGGTGAQSLSAAAAAETALDSPSDLTQMPLPASPEDLVALPMQNGDRESDFEHEVADAEIDQAFLGAKPESDQMLSANRMAERALLDHAPSAETGETSEEGFEVYEGSAFNTSTMATLLERQGDSAGASAIRDSLGGGSSERRSPRAGDAAELLAAASQEWPAADTPVAGKARILAVLESWLHNLQRGVA